RLDQRDEHVETALVVQAAKVDEADAQVGRDRLGGVDELGRPSRLLRLNIVGHVQLVVLEAVGRDRVGVVGLLGRRALAGPGLGHVVPLALLAELVVLGGHVGVGVVLVLFLGAQVVL